MAITFDAVTSFKNCTGATSNTFAHTVGAGLSNGALFVGISQNGSGTPGFSVTYNGVSMTSLYNNLPPPAVNSGYLFWYGLANPASGANNVVITSTPSLVIVAFAISFSGVDQTTLANASAKGGGASGTTETTTVTTVTDNSQVMDIVVGTSDLTHTVPAAQTIRGTPQNCTTNELASISTANSLTSPAGAQDMVRNFSASNPNDSLVIAIKPVIPDMTAETRQSMQDNIIQNYRGYIPTPL